MRYRLSPGSALKRLETPCLYDFSKDELYELDHEAFDFIARCAYEGADVAENEFLRYCLDEGILTGVTEQRPGVLLRSGPWPVSRSPVPSLRYLELQITKRCNLRCRHCFIGAPEDVGLSPEAVAAVIGEFESMQGLRLLITGGEPLMHPAFGEINELLPDYSLRRVLITNGTLVTQGLLRRLNVHELQISIDGLKASHESIRGKGTFGPAMHAIEMALDAGFDVSAATMLHPENLHDLEAMDEKFRALGLKSWTVDIPCRQGNMANSDGLRLAPEAAGGYLKYGFGGGLHGGHGPLRESRDDDNSGGFACGLHLMAVLADGRAAKCAFYGDEPVGHISEGIGTCWGRIKPLTLDSIECGLCSERAACRGGCRRRAELACSAAELAGPSGRDPYMCAFYGKIVKS